MAFIQKRGIRTAKRLTSQCSRFGANSLPAPNARLGLTVFPNPATATTTVVFELPQAGPVSLTVVDETGRQVRTVLSEQPTARGPQQRPVPLQNLPAGLYFLRLEAGGVIQTEKLIVR